MNVEVKKITHEDLAQAASLSSQLGYPVDPGEFEVRWRELQADPDHFLVGAYSQSKLVGILHARVVRDWLESHCVELAALVVDERARGQGLGETLVQAAERWAQDLGYFQIMLTSNVVRDRAHRFYERLGFRKTKTSAFFSKDLSHK